MDRHKIAKVTKYVGLFFIAMFVLASAIGYGMFFLLLNQDGEATVSVGPVEIVALFLIAALVAIPAMIAARKGHSAVLFAIFGLLFWPGAMIVALWIKPRPTPNLS